VCVEQVAHDRDGYATNKAAISDKLSGQQRRCEQISKFGCDHSMDVSLYQSAGIIPCTSRLNDRRRLGQHATNTTQQRR